MLKNSVFYSVVDFKDKFKNMIRNWSRSHSKEFLLVFSVWSANVGPTAVVWMFTITIKNTERVYFKFFYQLKEKDEEKGA